VRNVRLPLAIVLLLAGILGLSSTASAQSGQAASVPEVSVEGVVDPFLASYVEEAIDDANAVGNGAILLTIDTPGGLSSSMRDIIQAILNSRVPVICWVGPQGARAASAGAFILLSCPLAAMAPGTNVGAAHPVGVSGVIESQKAENDAAAYIRSLAEARGRNADWAESAVRDSVSATAEEALDLDVIDLIAADRTELLAEADGREVEVGGGETAKLETAGAVVDEREMGLGASILHALLTPDLAFLFFFLGIILLIVEVLHPGVSVPGVLGLLMLAASFIALGQLPVTVVGLVLLAISAISFFVDLKAPGTGAATAIGLITLILGGLFLFDSSVPNARVSIPTIGAVAVLLALFFGFTVKKVLEARRLPAESGQEALVGSVGVTETRIAPAGNVRVRSESWSAYTTGDPIPKGTPVVVRAVNSLRLEVEPAPSETPVEAGAEKGIES
jgi:membrane-bound serine protease (ClpP class)